MNTLRFASLALGLAAMACVDTTIPTGPDFGEGYSVQLEPDAPVLGDSTVSVTVIVVSGCRVGDFVLMYQVRLGGVDIWLRKVTPSGACDAYLVERRELAVPEVVRTANDVRLLNPGGDPYRLRP